MEDRAPTSADKGKSRAGDEQSSGSSASAAPAATQQRSNGSLATRVLDSATRLARDLVGSGNGSLASSLAASTSASGKIIPSASAAGRLERPLESSQNIQNNHVSGTNGILQGEAFRSAEGDSTISEEYNDFQQPQPLTQDIAFARQQDTSNEWVSEFTAPSNHIAEYSQSDGLEVSQLLADPYFVAMTADAEPEPDQTAADAADLFTTEPMTPAEQAAAHKLKAELPAPPLHQPVAADHPRNLVADFESLVAAAGEHGDGTGTVAVDAGSMVHFHSEAQRRQWYSEWSGVLNRYTDEVWGDMLPMVKEEQRYAESVREGTDSLDSKSVQRLNMILGHVEQYRHAHDGGGPA